MKPPRAGITRREAIGGAAALGIGAGLDQMLGRTSSRSTPEPVATTQVPFAGAHQAGVLTPPPEFVNFAAFDVSSDSLDDLRELLEAWTVAAKALTAGRPYTPSQQTGAVIDTGEAEGLGPSALTLTFGFGPSLFDHSGGGLAVLADRRPPALMPLPHFGGEDLDPLRSDGDLCVQACAEDAQVAFHAIHMMTRLASGTATLRWSQQGFGRTASTTRKQATPRNLMGFKDGTANIRAEEPEAVERYVWAAAGDGCPWMAGGTYAVVRRIRILFDVWDPTSVSDQERIIGRTKKSGAPLGERDEYDPIDLTAVRDGQPVIPADAHVRLTSPKVNAGQRILRRGFSYVEPPEPNSGSIDAGLLFICFQRDPVRQFVAIQRRLASTDALSRHTQHTASALFAIPPGVREGSFVGETLFA